MGVQAFFGLLIFIGLFRLLAFLSNLNFYPHDLGPCGEKLNERGLCYYSEVAISESLDQKAFYSLLLHVKSDFLALYHLYKGTYLQSLISHLYPD